MAATNPYCSLTELRARLQFSSTDTADDTILESIMTAVSRMIDNYTGRRFYRNSEDETRYYTAEFGDVLYCPDDIGSLTSLKTDEDGDRTYETTWADTDYDLEPFNAVLDGQPYTKIRVNAGTGSYAFPTLVKAVQLIGKFGYSTTAPLLIKEACLLQCERLFKRKDAPFGVLGAGGIGQAMVIPQLDPDVQIMLYQFVRFL